MTVALIQTTGVIQLVIAIFVVLFPPGVAYAFFVILYRRNWVFFAPGDYRTEQEMLTFKNISVSNTEASKMGKELKDKVSEVVQDNTLVEKVVESIQSSYLTFNSKPLLGSSGTVWTVPHVQFSTVQDMLNYVFLSLPSGSLPAFSYGSAWVLEDEKTKRFLRIWAVGPPATGGIQGLWRKLELSEECTY